MCVIFLFLLLTGGVDYILVFACYRWCVLYIVLACNSCCVLYFCISMLQLECYLVTACVDYILVSAWNS